MHYNRDLFEARYHRETLNNNLPSSRRDLRVEKEG